MELNIFLNLYYWLLILSYWNIYVSVNDGVDDSKNLLKLLKVSLSSMGEVK